MRSLLPRRRCVLNHSRAAGGRAHRAAARARAFGCTAAALLVWCTRAEGSMICFYVDCPAGSNIGLPVSAGHGFVSFTPMNGPGAGVPVFRGFYPSTWNIFGGAGIVKNDATRPWDWRICYNVTVAQYNAAIAANNARTVTPGAYNVLTRNCVDFQSTIAAAAGITLPPTVGIYGASDPAVLWTSMRDIKNGTTPAPAGGTVQPNPGPVSAAGQPNNYSVAGIATQARTDLPGLASYTHLPLNQVNLGAVNSNLGSGVSINLGAIDLGNSLVSVNWGDGSPWEQQASLFNHVYAPGTYAADVLVMDSGSIHFFSMNVFVSSGPGAMLDLNFSSFPPATGLNETTYADGTPIDFDIVPAPGTGAGLALAGLILARRRRPR